MKMRKLPYKDLSIHWNRPIDTISVKQQQHFVFAHLLLFEVAYLMTYNYEEIHVGPAFKGTY